MDITLNGSYEILDMRYRIYCSIATLNHRYGNVAMIQGSSALRPLLTHYKPSEFHTQYDDTRMYEKNVIVAILGNERRKYTNELVETLSKSFDNCDVHWKTNSVSIDVYSLLYIYKVILLIQPYFETPRDVFALQINDCAKIGCFPRGDKHVEDVNVFVSPSFIRAIVTRVNYFQGIQATSVRNVFFNTLQIFTTYEEPPMLTYYHTFKQSYDSKDLIIYDPIGTKLPVYKDPYAPYKELFLTYYLNTILLDAFGIVDTRKVKLSFDRPKYVFKYRKRDVLRLHIPMRDFLSYMPPDWKYTKITPLSNVLFYFPIEKYTYLNQKYSSADMPLVIKYDIDRAQSLKSIGFRNYSNLNWIRNNLTLLK